MARRCAKLYRMLRFTIGVVLCVSSVAAEAPVAELVHDGPATPEQISLYLPVTGPLSSDAAASVRYRPATASQWRDAHPLYRIRPADSEGTPSDAFAGVITGLVPGETYVVEVGVEAGEERKVLTLSSTTRALPPAAGPASRQIAAGTPSADIQAVFDEVQPGEVIQFADGTYEVDELQIRKGGTPERPVVIRGASREGVVLRDRSGNVVQLLEVSDVVLENLTIEGSRSDPGIRPASRGIDLWRGPGPQRRITLRNLHVVGVDMGIVAWRDTEALLVYDNTLEGNDVWTPEFIETNLTWNDDGIRVPGTGHAVFHNTLTGFGDAMAVADRFVNVGVHFYRNDVRRTGDDGFEADYGMRNLSFYDNRIHNSATLVSCDPVYGGPVFVFRNIAINTVRGPYKLNNRNSGMLIYNNTVVRTEGFKGGKDWGWVQYNNGPLVAWAFRNNLLVYRGAGGLLAIESTGQDPIDFDHNAWHPDRKVWWTRSGGSFAGVRDARARLPATRPLFGTSKKRHDGDVPCEVDPFEIDVELGPDHRREIVTPYTPKLADRSAPRAKGVAIPGITDGFAGPAPDIGALISGREVPAWGDRNPRPKVAPEPAADAPKTDRLAPSGSPGSADSDTLPVSSSPGIIEPGGHG